MWITQDLINDIGQLIGGDAQDAVRPEEGGSALAGISRGLRARKENELEVGGEKLHMTEKTIH